MDKSKTETNPVDKQESNPISKSDQKAVRIEPSIETDKFSIEEQKDIVKMVIQDAESDIEEMAEWLTDKVQDVKDYEALPPSQLEGLKKKPWQSDRNLGMCPGTCDAYQATLTATCINSETIHYKTARETSADRKDNVTEFTKWGLGRAESNVYQEWDDFIHNRITQGFSVLEVYWKVWYQWIDRRIPIYGKDLKLKRYEIKTEKVRFEKGIIENVANLEDFLTPTFGKTIQELPHCIKVLHITGLDMLDYSDRKIFTPLTEKYIEKLKNVCFDYRLKQIQAEKAKQLGLKDASDVTNVDLRVFPVDVYTWYGMYTKNGRTERYRFYVEPTTKKFLGGKPLRKVPGCRDGNYPFVGGALIRRPGFLRGKSLPRYIRHIINALNNIYNQKSDFQYVENCPSGWYKPDENYSKQQFDLEPGVLFPSDDPQQINMPNLSRSMAWADSDIRLLLELLERLTGAASYFMTNQTGVSGTATRDAIINEKSETRFGLWVKRIQEDLCASVDLWLKMYQDNAPPTLAERVLGEDGKKLFPNLSIETLQGEYNCYMNPDIISGSKTMEKQIYGMAMQMAQTSPWFDPQINPRGSWELTADTFKKMGLVNIESYMPPKPPPAFGTGKQIEKVWSQFMQGEIPEIDETANNMELAAGLAQIASTRYNDLDEEYRPNFDNYMMKLGITMRQQMKKAQEDQIARAMSSKIITDISNGTSGGAQPAQPTPALPNPGAPNGPPAGNPALPIAAA